jgi:hypothetical protein
MLPLPITLVRKFCASWHLNLWKRLTFLSWRTTICPIFQRSFCMASDHQGSFDPMLL